MFYQFVENEQFNFQINRIATYGGNYFNYEEVSEIFQQLKDMDSWTKAWMKLAVKAEKEKRYNHAIYYYRLAEFYMPDCSSDKNLCYSKFKECFDKAHSDTDMERFEIPYSNTFLPAIRIKAQNEKGALVVHGGYDSFMEEFYPIIRKCVKMGYTLIMFEGPGQGQARKNGLTFCYDWEKPTSVILDFFKLQNITLLGISWGGYLAPRAAAYDKRIKNVICYDIFYWGLDIILNQISQKDGNRLVNLLKYHFKLPVNIFLKQKMKEHIDLHWKISHGMYITGAETPYDFLKNIENHKLSTCLDKITQNVLLLAGEKDQYVPVCRMEQIIAGLNNAKSVTAKIFTEQEGGEQHCQVGNIELAQKYIYDYMKNYN